MTAEQPTGERDVEIYEAIEAWWERGDRGPFRRLADEDKREAFRRVDRLCESLLEQINEGENP